MKEDLLFDALNEVKDEHIKEAADYEPKAKLFTPKRILALASCVTIVAVSAFAINKFTSPSVSPATTTPTYAAIDTTNKKQDEALTYPAIATTQIPADTEIATEIGETEIYMETTAPDTTATCQTVPAWENRSITNKYSLAEYNGKRYFYSDRDAKFEDLEKVLCYLTLTGTDYRNDNKTYETAVTVYKLKEFSEELFIAINFQYENDDNFYIYECQDYMPDDVKDFLSDTNFEKYVSVGEEYKVFHEVRGPVVSSVTMSDSTDEIISALIELLNSNPDVKAFEAPSYNDANEHISFGFRLKDYYCHAHFNENGRLALSVGGFFYFDFTKEDYDEFIKLVEKNEKGKAPLSPVTTPSTNGAVTNPDGVVTSPGYNPDENSTPPATAVTPTTGNPDGALTSSGYNPQVSTTAAPPVTGTEQPAEKQNEVVTFPPYHPYAPTTSEEVSFMP